VSEAFAAEGARVVLTYRTQKDGAQETADRINAHGGSARVLQLDVRDRAAFEQVVRECEEEGPLDILVNNAAIVHDQAFALMGSDAWDRVIDTNLTGTYNGCRAAIQPMMGRGVGTIVNVVSVAGIRASPGQANYAASKGGVIALTQTLAAEMARYGIRVNGIMPGLLEVGMGSRLDHRVTEQRIEQVPLGRLGTAREAANAVLFLSSEEASYIVGQVITVDGGLTL
jgi:3-oxoacyl-[acyl-carrier protein] reductase